MTTARRVLITGASRGFGAALAERFAARGDRVFAGVRTGSEARVTESGGLALVPLDVADDASVHRARALVAAETPAIDVLVNNAAIRSRTVNEPVESIDFRDVAQTFDVNAIGPLRVVQAFLPMLRLGRSPILVNVSSEAGSLDWCKRERELDYCMSKAALNMATVILANYLRGRVKVISLHPGWLRTDMGGPNAALDPHEVAKLVADVVIREAASPSGSLFVDYEGKPMPW
jgi:NAD(P)-dependent dehydrogenase (short-subunit alcohol dehydrogenase family)